jgi:hypothetical protein
MCKVIKNLGSKSAVIIFILVLGAWPVGGLAKTSPAPWLQNLQDEIHKLELRISILEQRINALIARIVARVASPSR